MEKVLHYKTTNGKTYVYAKIVQKTDHYINDVIKELEIFSIKKIIIYYKS